MNNKTKITGVSDWDKSIWDGEALKQHITIRDAMGTTLSTSSTGITYGGPLSGHTPVTGVCGTAVSPYTLLDAMERGLLYRFNNRLYIIEIDSDVAHFRGSGGTWLVSEYSNAVIMEGKSLGTISGLLGKLSKSIDENPL